MRFNGHLELEGKHAFLSPSKSSWLRYDKTQLTNRYHSRRAAQRGSDLHDFAHEAIRLGVALHDDNKALCQYVRHGLEFGMACEVGLYYSDNCFGHADTLGFDGITLRIHDLKTGITPSKMEQLKVYAALFCLEYGVDPAEIQIELRIYQRDDMMVESPNPTEIVDIMGTIIDFDRFIESLEEVN